MTAKILAVLGAIGLIATIWTADLRFLWTGLLLLVISVGIASQADKRRKDQAWQDGHDTALMNGQSENPHRKE